MRDLLTYPPGQPIALSPTDISQFIRLEQCERYLRLRLQERVSGPGALTKGGVSLQAIPPLLTRSGRLFEERIEREIASRIQTHHFSRPTRSSREDNEAVLHFVSRLEPGETRVLFQPRLRVRLDGLVVTGDIDLLRLERDGQGGLEILIADIKSSNAVRVEHRLQVAFYHRMLERLLSDASIPAGIRTSILYRGAPHEALACDPDDEAADRVFHLTDASLELIADAESYLEAVSDLVTGEASLTRRVMSTPFDRIPFHLSLKCDGCLYNEFCMRWCAERDDLSLLPHLSGAEKNVLLRAGVGTVRELAELKTLEKRDGETPTLSPAPEREPLARRLAVTWPVGPRLDELVLRARRYRKWKGDPLETLVSIPSKGHSTLPYRDATLNPNLVMVYVDAQHDYLQNRLYLLGALVVAHEAGRPVRRRSLVRLSEGPPDDAAERELFMSWIDDLLRAIAELAEPDADGTPRAPIHLVFYNRFVRDRLLDRLSAHLGEILGAAPALYDFMTQLAAFDSPVATYLEDEIRELKNYPMVCQSLQSVARYLRFDWNLGASYVEIFRERLFDYLGKLVHADGAEEWFTRRARFNSQIPLEYAYAAWGDLDSPATGRQDDLAPYRRATPALLRGFEARRLEALEHIAADFRGNALTQKTAFMLPGLARFTDRARSLAQALDEFVTIERHVWLSDWRRIRHVSPERRVLMGETLLARYHEHDQAPEAAARNRENARRKPLRDAFRAANPGVKLTKQQQSELNWSSDGLCLRLRLEADGVDCNLAEVLALTTLKEGGKVVIAPRWTVDGRLERERQAPFTPTPKQLLYAQRAEIKTIEVERDASGHPRSVMIALELKAPRGGPWARGFVFGAFETPLTDHELYTIDPSPDDWYGYFSSAVVAELRAHEQGAPASGAVYERLARPGTSALPWPQAARDHQERFLAGLEAMHRAGLLHDFESSKRDYIGRFGDAPVLLVQGPPGTGKSYTTAFALFARIQGAMAAGREFRAFLSCKTHAATDVLLEDMVEVQHVLRTLRAKDPQRFAEYFDERLLEVPLFRLHPRESTVPGARVLHRDLPVNERLAALQESPWAIVAATPGGVYRLVKDKWSKPLLGHALCDCLILDEASQMNLPEAMLAALLLKAEGMFIVVGDPRQMPPIVHHEWDSEPRRTFREYKAYESLFQSLLPLDPPMVKFTESFRLHRDMAEFLRQEIYRKDGIPFFSRRQDRLPDIAGLDPYVSAALSGAHPLVVVVHDEEQSQVRNALEQALIEPLIEALVEHHGLDPQRGIGVVVPHRAQRAAFQEAFPQLALTDPANGEILGWAVDTVERFQGGERTVVVVSATESDRDYLLASSDFLLDPRRLTVALSRAKQKLVLVAARNVFSLFSPRDEAFENALLWKNLLRRTCTELLWEGLRENQHVQVWGSLVSRED